MAMIIVALTSMTFSFIILTIIEKDPGVRTWFLIQVIFGVLALFQAYVLK